MNEGLNKIEKFKKRYFKYGLSEEKWNKTQGNEKQDDRSFREITEEEFNKIKLEHPIKKTLNTIEANNQNQLESILKRFKGWPEEYQG